jgi:hypothetical protein
MKSCTECGKDLDESAFYVNRAAEDGLTYKCKVCISAYQKARRDQKAVLKSKDWKMKTADMATYMREWRKANPEKCRQYESKRPKRTSEEERAKYARKMKRLHGEDYVVGERKNRTGGVVGLLTPEVIALRQAARKKARRAVSLGKLTKLPCWTCGNTEVEAHHTDYSRPLDVVWLCAEHHREVHS